MIEEKDRVRDLLYCLEMYRKKYLQPYFSGIGLTLGQGQPRILYNLLKKENVTQKELAENCFMDVTTLSRSLDRLEDAGMLCRKSNPQSRRSYSIELTEEGRNRAQQVADGFRMIDDAVCEGFEEEELEVVYQGLRKMAGNLEKLNGREYRE